MKILLTSDVYLRLSMIESVTQGREFSGYGFVKVHTTPEETIFMIYDIELLDVGTVGYTEFDSSAILKAMEREDAQAMKCWFHRHPLGNGKPGPHNWSKTDNDTCKNEPLGCPDPDKVKWALAMVLTPGGWVGRIDQYQGDNQLTKHLVVDVDVAWRDVEQAKQLLKKQLEAEKEPGWQIPDYFKARGEYHQDNQSAQAAIDEAFNIIAAAKLQLEDGYIQEAIDSTAWVYDIARYYERHTTVRNRAKKLLKEARSVMRLLRKDGKDHD